MGWLSIAGKMLISGLITAAAVFVFSPAALPLAVLLDRCFSCGFYMALAVGIVGCRIL